MTHVVERCPACGVEHDEAVGGACEACGTPLRSWCRRHGRDAGWLDGPVCPRCAHEAARPALSPSPTPARTDAPPQAPLAAPHPPAPLAVGEPEQPLGLLGHLRFVGAVTLILVIGCGTLGALAGTALALLGGDWGLLPLAIKVGAGVGLFASAAGTANYVFDFSRGTDE